MASNKALLLLALLVASAAVLATSAVNQQTHDNKDEKMATVDAAGMKDDGGSGSIDQYGHNCENGCCHRVYHGGCQKCCPPDAGRRPKVKN